MPKWIEKWEVPSSSSDKNWIVSRAEDDSYGCSCPVWKFRRQECHHIKLVKSGAITALQEKGVPEYILATVDKPTYNEREHKLYIPLVGIPDALMMEVTICFNMLKYGFSMGQVRKQRRIPGDWSARRIMAHIDRHGEAEYPKGWYRR